ncbi:hypothetical protein RE438_31210 (plasmid) [Bacillus wiedmannii]|uniref:hypothetical protein n=1 Tax=Bacillus wiedmannii TaxID=1890302 RepID=UPI00288334C6|nr:hypothetical protein [Bacillus wiedmannii]WMS85341.1 hypothetical protein RE438_31210 [Bacillus wiedmannii]
MIQFMSRKVYDRQFKMAAVQLVLEENMFVKKVAKELSIHSHIGLYYNTKRMHYSLDYLSPIEFEKDYS